jgi:6-phosphogluconolactonase (cycloisomerase 2 family)
MPSHDTKGAVAIYASAGPHLIRFDVDAGRTRLMPASTVTLPENVHYVVCHPALPILYVAASPGIDGAHHYLAAFTIGKDGTLSPFGDPVALPHRTIHFTIDGAGKFALLASNKPRTITVYHLGADGHIGALVKQDPPADGGFFVHQVRLFRDGRTVVAPALGWHKTDTAPEHLGQITTFALKNGRLTRLSNVVPGPGLGPRHVDFHPTLKLVYVAVERGNRLNVYPLEDGKLPPTPRDSVTTLREPGNLRGNQHAGAIHVHPNGRFVYLTNRNDTVSAQGTYPGGENTLVVFALDPKTGEPKLMQHEETHGFEPRTFTIAQDFIVVANQKPMTLDSGKQVRPNLALFKLATDGRVSFVSTTDLPREGEAMWVGAVALPK